eukprot:gene5759-7167_t
MKYFIAFVLLFAAIASANVEFVNINFCSYLNTCIKIGELCDITSPTNSTETLSNYACEYGSFCPTDTSNKQRVCTPYAQVGEYCGDNQYTKCFPGSLNCYHPAGKAPATCQVVNYLGVGESCETSLQCDTNLICDQGACAVDPDQVRKGCNIGARDQCPYGQVCATLDDDNNHCVAALTQGASCNTTAQCAYGYTCTYSSNTDTDFATTCQVVSSKNNGDRCLASNNIDGYASSVVSVLSPDCDVGAGLLCSSTTSKCVTLESIQTSSSTNCTSNPCNPQAAEVCVCNQNGDGRQGVCKTQYSLNGSCKTFVQNVNQCAADNKCVISSAVISESCLYKHCKKYLCESNPCSVNVYGATQCNAGTSGLCQDNSSSSFLAPSVFLAAVFAIIALLF